MPEPKPWSKPVLLAAGLAVGLGAAAGVVLAIMLGNGAMIDLQVYRGAVQAWLSGQGLYEFELIGDAGEVMPFTYPPFAAMILVPAALLPSPLAKTLGIAALSAVVGFLVTILMRRAPGASPKVSLQAVVAGALATFALLFTVPVTHGIVMGQISLVLIAMSLADAGGVVPRRWRGVLVGLAGAIKLTPLAFLPYFLITRQWRAARNAALAFGGATLLAFALAPTESAKYWTQLVFETGRVGEASLSRNFSLFGLLSRWDIGGDQLRLLWLALVAVISILAFWRASRHHARGEDLAAAIVVGTLSVVVSPMSWPHHAVWVPLAGIYLILLRTTPHRRWAVAIGVLLLLGFVDGSPLVLWKPPESLTIALLAELLTLAGVAVAAFGLPRRGPAQATASDLVDAVSEPVGVSA